MEENLSAWFSSSELTFYWGLAILELWNYLLYPYNFCFALSLTQETIIKTLAQNVALVWDPSMTAKFNEGGIVE